MEAAGIEPRTISFGASRALGLRANLRCSFQSSLAD
jgi:hypothetical protein